MNLRIKKYKAKEQKTHISDSDTKNYDKIDGDLHEDMNNKKINHSHDFGSNLSRNPQKKVFCGSSQMLTCFT